MAHHLRDDLVLGQNSLVIGVPVEGQLAQDELLLLGGVFVPEPFLYVPFAQQHLHAPLVQIDPPLGQFPVLLVDDRDDRNHKGVSRQRLDLLVLLDRAEHRRCSCRVFVAEPVVDELLYLLVVEVHQFDFGKPLQFIMITGNSRCHKDPCQGNRVKEK